ncbi:MAG: PDZ domain-containing protein [Planctomycetota bacterium]
MTEATPARPRSSRIWIPTLLAGAAVAAPLLGAAGLAQETEAPEAPEATEAQPAPPAPAEPRGLVPLLPDESAGARAEFVPKEWRDALTHPDLDAREEAFERMVRLARSSEEAFAWLRAVSGEADRELAWTARLLLREVETSMAEDPFALFGRTQDLSELERRLKEFTTRLAPSWNRQVDPLVVPFAGLTRPNPTFPGAGSSKSFNIENGSDGWVVRVVEAEDGEESVREFRGETLEEILEANPELKNEPGISAMISGEGFSLRIGGPGDVPFDFDQLLGQFGPGQPRGKVWLRGPARLQPAEPLRTDVLGVAVRSIESAEGATGASHGLYVLSTAPGTIAQLLGILPGDVLLRVNGKQLKTEADLTEALAERPEDGSVETVWRDALGRRRSGIWRP